MKTRTMRGGPGPMTADPEDERDPSIGAVLLDFYPDRVSVGLVAEEKGAEAQVRARLDRWALEHVSALLRRRLSVPAAAPSCGGRCRCREEGR